MTFPQPLTQHPSWWSWMGVSAQGWLRNDHPHFAPLSERHVRGWAACQRLFHGRADDEIQGAIDGAVACGVERTWLVEELLEVRNTRGFTAVIADQPQWHQWGRSFPDSRLGKKSESEAPHNLRRRDDCADLPSLMGWIVARGPVVGAVKAAINAGWDPCAPMEAHLKDLQVLRPPQPTSWTPLAVAVAHGNLGALEALWADARVRRDQDSLDEAFFLAACLLHPPGRSQPLGRAHEIFLANGAKWVSAFLQAGANPNRPFPVSRFGRSRGAISEQSEWVPDTGGHLWTVARLQGGPKTPSSTALAAAIWPLLSPLLTPESWPLVHEDDPLRQAVQHWNPQADHAGLRQALSVLGRTRRPTTAVDMVGRVLAHLLEGKPHGDLNEADLQAEHTRTPHELRRLMLPLCTEDNGAWPMGWAVAEGQEPMPWSEVADVLTEALAPPNPDKPNVRPPPGPPLSLGDHMGPEDGERWRVLHAEIDQLARGRPLLLLNEADRQVLRLRVSTAVPENKPAPPRMRL